MSSSTSNGATATQQEVSSAHGNVVFVLPPPPTIWVQFNDGTRVAFTPSPAQYLQSVLHGVPVFGSTSESSNASGNSSDGFLNALNELFQRAQEQQQHGPPPTNKVFLDELPVKMWTTTMQTSERHSECVICLSDYEKDDKVLALPCGHMFHKECGMKWLVEHNICPTCRFQLPTEGQSDGTLTVPQIVPQAAATAPEQVPSIQDPNVSVTGMRRQRPSAMFHPRDVRQRVSESSALTLVSVDDDAELDRMLEQEADRFVREEMKRDRAVGKDDGVEIEDRDVEELLHEPRSN
uniref:RING-type domain-containing protein n=2 Tax=Hyaloperonospora arabidopsidis (strain Emoy2) TaxID=559515 RepID=M4BMH0_HYAAE